MNRPTFSPSPPRPAPCRSAFSRPTSAPLRPAPPCRPPRRLRPPRRCSPRRSAAAVADAANAFLATLSEKQRAVAQIELTHRLAARWTNFPGGSNVRNGVFFRDSMPDAGRRGPEGRRVWPWARRASARYQEVRAADDAFAKRARRPRARWPRPGGRAWRRARRTGRRSRRAASGRWPLRAVRREQGRQAEPGRGAGVPPRPVR